MKSISSLLMIFSLVFSTPTIANTLSKNNDQLSQELNPDDEGTLGEQENDLDLLEYSDGENEYVSDFNNDLGENQEVESDSSYYSVNKFNILLYFVYKLKYGEEDVPTED